MWSKIRALFTTNEYEEGRKHAREMIRIGRSTAVRAELRGAMEGDEFTRGMADELVAQGLLMVEVV